MSSFFHVWAFHDYEKQAEPAFVRVAVSPRQSGLLLTYLPSA